MGIDFESFRQFSAQFILGAKVYLYIGITLSVYNIAPAKEVCNMGNCTNSQNSLFAKGRFVQNKQKDIDQYEFLNKG